MLRFVLITTEIFFFKKCPETAVFNRFDEYKHNTKNGINKYYPGKGAAQMFW